MPFVWRMNPASVLKSHTVFVWSVVSLVGVVGVRLSPLPFPPPSQEVRSDPAPRYRNILAGAFHCLIADSLFLPQTCCVEHLPVCFKPHASLSRCLTDPLTLSQVFWERLTVWVKDQSSRLPLILPPAFTPIFHPTQTQQPSLRGSYCFFLFVFV